MQDKNLELMEKAPVPKAILTLGLPTVFSSIMTLLYNLADTYFIGMMDNIYHLGAAHLAYPIFIVVQSIGNIFGIGASPFISRSLGAQEYDKTKKISSVSIYTSTLITFGLTAVYFLFHDGFLGMLGTSANNYEPTKQYLDWIVAFGFLMTLQNVLSSFLRAEGKVRQAVTGMVIGMAANIVLDPIFILKFGLGAGGAAIATVIGNALSVLYFLVIYFGKNTNLSARFKDFKPSKEIYREVLKIGIPASAGQLLMGITNAMFNNLAAGYGDHVISGYGTAGKLIYIVIIIVNGYTSGYMPFASYNLGAGKIKRMKDSFKFTLLSSTILGLVLVVPFVGLARPFMSAFTSDTRAIDVGVLFLKIYAVCLPALGIQFTMMSTLQVLGKAARAMVVNIGRQTVFFLPVLYLLNHWFKLTGLVAVTPVADIITTLVAAILVAAPLKKLYQTGKEEEMQNG